MWPVSIPLSSALHPSQQLLSFTLISLLHFQEGLSNVFPTGQNCYPVPVLGIAGLVCLILVFLFP